MNFIVKPVLFSQPKARVLRKLETGSWGPRYGVPFSGRIRSAPLTAPRGTRKVRVFPGVEIESGLALSSTGPIATLSPGQKPAPLTVTWVPDLPSCGASGVGGETESIRIGSIAIVPVDSRWAYPVGAAVTTIGTSSASASRSIPTVSTIFASLPG